MTEGSVATVIPSQLQEINDLPTVTSRIVSSHTIQKVNKTLSHNTNGDNTPGSTESDEETPSQETPCQLEESSLNSKPDDHYCLCDVNLENQESDIVQKLPSIAQALLDEIDNSSAKEIPEPKSIKKGGTLTKMFRSIRKEKDSESTTPEDRDSETVAGTSTMSIGKLIQKVNPVGKNNRETMSKALHRIGDAFQKITQNNNEENPENISESNKTTFRRLIQFHHLSKSKSSSNDTDQPVKSKPDSNLSCEKSNDKAENSI